ncbi:nuclear receptor-interacting protein 1 [Discoglossus pictus]
MTHGEELSSEMQQDSIVLTYLEGLLMHQAAGGSGTTVDKLSVGRAKTDDNLKISGNIFSNSQSNAPVQNNKPCQGSGMLHLKKARLLQSSEDWNAAKRRRLSNSVVELNGKNEALLAGMVENAPKSKQDSTLLASLLQSFSSRLQSVALSQQIKQTLKDQGFSLNQEVIHEEKDSRCLGVASNHLKTLLNKSRSRSKDKTPDNPVPKKSSQDKYESPHSGQNSRKGAVEPISCAARLQAVASMVENRSSPTASPKPSVACSQLALLLSSEAHLQQYSREHALKAQNASQLASERLAAMARLKESSEQDLGQFQMSANSPVNLNSPARTISNPTCNVNSMSPFPNQLGVPSSPHKTVSYKNHADHRNHMKASPSNSLLLHLLKNQSSSSVAKNQLQTEKYPLFEESATPTTTDDLSDNNPSFTEDDSSDDESTHSNSAPIDLSFKNRVDKPVHFPEQLHTESLDNLTESLLHNWDPKVGGLEIGKDSSPDSSLKSHQKVTLLQLLLGHKMDEDHETVADARGTPKAADLTKFNLPTQNHVHENTRIHNSSPLHTINLHNSIKADSPVNMTHQSFPVKVNYPSYIGSIQPDRLVNPASKHLVELTRSKSLQAPPVPLTNDNAPNNAAFSASKLLQNLAQCGKAVSPDEQRLPKPLSASNGKPLGLIDRLNSPLLTSQTHAAEESRAFSSPSTPVDSGFPGSEIENLLERRTVLQLLLGTTNNKSKSEKVQKPAIKEENPPEKTSKLTSEQIVTVKVKTEPEDYSSAQHVQGMSAPSPMRMSPHKMSKSSVGDMRSQHHSPQDFSTARNGLLSRLLRQNHDGYDNLDMDINNRNSDHKQTDSKIPCVVPKKRKMHQNDSSESKLKMAKNKSIDNGNQQFCTTQSLCGPMFLQEEINGNKTDAESNCTLGQSAFNESKNVNWSRESKGFNVLKQLLLSENCVRDLSPHRNNASLEEMMKVNRSNLACNSDFVVPSLNALMGSPTHQTNNLSPMPFHYPSSVNNCSYAPSSEVFGNKSQTDSGQFNVCPASTDKGPIKWVITGMEKNYFVKDSPRLTKTNPILYYMLQKGGHSALSQELRDRTSWTESLLGNSTEMSLKRESVSRGASTNGIGLTKSSSHVGNKTFHNSNGNKYGLFDMLAIKKEPE